MKFTSKVKMPKPEHRGPTGTGTYFDSYSKQQMEEYANERVKEALEAAAQEVELTHSNSDDQDMFQRRAAEAVRALVNYDTE